MRHKTLFPEPELPPAATPIKPLAPGQRDPISEEEYNRDVKPILKRLGVIPDEHRIYLALTDLTRMEICLKLVLERKRHPRAPESDEEEARRFERHVRGLALSRKEGKRAKDGRIEIRATREILEDLGLCLLQTNAADLAASVACQLEQTF